MLKSRTLSAIIIGLISIGTLLLGNTIMDSGLGDTKIKDGTYEGVSDAGMYPGLKVAVTFENGNISKVEVVEHQESPGIADVAIERIPAIIVEKNSADVDVISGASYTSGAIIEAVKNVILAESEAEVSAE